MDIFIKAGANGSLVLMPELEKHFKDFSSNDDFTVLIPDMGSSKLGQSYAKRLGMSFALIDK